MTRFSRLGILCTLKQWSELGKNCLIRVGVFNSVKRVKKCCYDSSKSSLYT